MGNSSPLVVILDDNTAYADILCQSILPITDRVVAVTNPEEFFKLDLDDTKCVVLDFYLSETGSKYSDTGLEVLKWLRQKHHDIKVILHSGRAEARDVIDSAELGIYRYIPKGNQTKDIPLLVGTISDLLSLSHTQRDNLSPLPVDELANLKSRVEELTKAKDDFQREVESLRLIESAYETTKDQFEKVLNRASTTAASGERPGTLLDMILDDLIERADAKGGAWFLIGLSRLIFRNQNCTKLGRSVSLRGGPARVLGPQLWQEILEHGEKPYSLILGPIDANDAYGVFQGQKLYLCIFQIDAYDDKLLFVLEIPKSAGDVNQPLTLRTYVDGLNSILNILPLYIPEPEFGMFDKIGRWFEALVSLGQAIGRTVMSLLSFTLFVSTIISSFVTILVLIAATIGYPDFLEQVIHVRSEGFHAFHWNPTHYAVGIVTALEMFILSVTLYLLGIGLSCMLNHPRLTRVPFGLRYLDNPPEMKRSLILAITTLLAVAGLREILEFDLVGASAVKWTTVFAEFGGRMAFLVLLILILTFLLNMGSGQGMTSRRSTQAKGRSS